MKMFHVSVSVCIDHHFGNTGVVVRLSCKQMSSGTSSNDPGAP